MILWEYRGALQALVVLCLTIISWRRGAGPERKTATVLLAIVVATWLVRFLGFVGPQESQSGGFFGTAIGYMVIDCAALIALILIGMLANRRYPLWMAGFQLTATGMHFVNQFVASYAPLAYALLTILPFYFMIASQMLGLWLHVRREKRVGHYPSWRSLFDPLPETWQK